MGKKAKRMKRTLKTIGKLTKQTVGGLAAIGGTGLQASGKAFQLLGKSQDYIGKKTHKGGVKALKSGGSFKIGGKMRFGARKTRAHRIRPRR